MSLRTSRRSLAAAASAAGEDTPSVPISEIRARKWTKQIKTVGHITIVKWVPEQEHPTEALQRGGFKKTKGRKRPVAEVGRMTRSVRQHLDAPLELLVEMPPLRQSTRGAAAAAAAPAAPAVPAPEAPTTATEPAPTVPTAQPTAVPPPVPAAPVASSATPPSATPATAAGVGAAPALAMSSDPMMFSGDVASEEQLERELDDLPFLDSDNLALDPVLEREQQAAAHQSGQPRTRDPPASSQPAIENPAPLAAQPSPDAEASAASAEEQDDGASSSSDSSDDDEDDGDETASVDSATPQQSPSPTMSRSPSP